MTPTLTTIRAQAAEAERQAARCVDRKLAQQFRRGAARLREIEREILRR